MLDVIATLVWTYVFLKLFVFDVDRELVRKLAPDFLPLLNYRFFFLLGMLALVVLLAREYWWAVLYILFFPLVVLLWKIPRLIYRTKSWLVAFAFINAITTFIKDFKFNFLTKTVALFAMLGILISTRPVILVPACFYLLGLLIVSYYRNIRASFLPSRFIDLQVTAIEKFIGWEPITTNIYIAEDLKQAHVERFDEGQLRRFASNLSTGLPQVRLTPDV